MMWMAASHAAFLFAPSKDRDERDNSKDRHLYVDRRYQYWFYRKEGGSEKITPHHFKSERESTKKIGVKQIYS